MGTSSLLTEVLFFISARLINIDIGKSNVEKDWVNSLNRVKSVGPWGKGLAASQSGANLYTSSIVMNEMLHPKSQAANMYRQNDMNIEKVARNIISNGKKGAEFSPRKIQVNYSRGATPKK